MGVALAPKRNGFPRVFEAIRLVGVARRLGWTGVAVA